MAQWVRLGSLLRQIEAYSWEDELFLPEEEVWDIDTQGVVIATRDLAEEELTAFVKEKHLMEALDIGTIQEIVQYTLAGKPDCSEEELLDAYLYYYDKDAFLDV